MEPPPVFLGFLRFFLFLAGELCNEDADLVENHEGDGHKELADHIGRSQKRSDDEDEEYRIAPLLLQQIRGHDAHAAEKKRRHRKLENKSETKEQFNG